MLQACKATGALQPKGCGEETQIKTNCSVARLALRGLPRVLHEGSPRGEGNKSPGSNGLCQIPRFSNDRRRENWSGGLVSGGDAVPAGGC